jgi:hypothetical protein
MSSHLKEGLTAAVKTSHEYILYPFVSCIFHWYKYCKQSKNLCLKTLFSSILSWNDKQKHKNIKITYLFHRFLVEKRWLNQNRLIFICFWSDLNMNLSLSGATDFVKAKTPSIKVFIPKLLCYHIMKKACTFLPKLYVFLCVFCQFSRVFVYVFLIYLSTFQFLSASLWKYTTALISN